MQTDFFAPRDNLVFHLWNFLYHANSLTVYHTWPSWYPISGGTPTGVASMAWASVLPHRLIGYFSYLVGMGDAVTSYKLSILSGILLVGLGWWIFCFFIFNSYWISFLCTLFLVFTGQSITVLHQEHVIGSMIWIPWLLLLLLMSRDDVRFLVPLAWVGAVALTNCYPHYLAIPALYLLLSHACLRISVFRLPNNIRSHGTGTFFTAAVVFALTALPIIYILKMEPQFASPLRKTAEIHVSDLASYIRLNLVQASSATWDYIWNYLKPNPGLPDDALGLHLTYTVMILGLLSVFVKFRKALPLFLVVGLLVWTTVGVHAKVPHFFYAIKFPFISQFRQWYHFFPFTALAVIYLAGLTLHFLHEKLSTRWRNAVFLLIGVVFMFEATRYYRFYYRLYIKPMQHSFQPAGTLSKVEFDKFMNQDWIDWLRHREYKPLPQIWVGKTLVHVTFKERERWMVLCPLLFSNTPYSIPQKPINIIPAIREGAKLSFHFPFQCDRLRPIPFPKDQSDLIHRKSTPNHKITAVSDWQIHPRGFSLTKIPNLPGLILLPFSAKMNPEITTERGNILPAISLLDGAMTGVLSDGTFQTLRLKMPYTFYEFSLLVQFITFFAVLIFTCKILRLSR